MMLNDDAYTYLMELLKDIPEKAHFRLHAFNNIEFRKKWVVPDRKLDDYLLSFIKTGKGAYTFKDSHIEEVVPNKLIFVSKGCPHRAQATTEEIPSFYSIRFGLYLNDTGEMLAREEDFFAFGYMPTNAKYFRDTYDKLYELYLSCSDLSLFQKVANSIICELISHICIEKSYQTINRDLRLESAVLYTRRYIAEGVTVNKLAEISGLSESYFPKVFKREYGISPKVFISQCKLDYARSLIANHHYTVKEAALELGYSDQYIFSNQFKNYFGYRPSKSKETQHIHGPTIEVYK